MADPTKTKWFVKVVRECGLSYETEPVLPTEATPVQVWDALAGACGIDVRDLAGHIARHLKLNVADLERIDPYCLQLLPEKTARRFQLVPLREDDQHLYVATSCPVDFDAQKAVTFASGRAPVFEIAPPGLLDDAIETHYSPNRAVEGLLRGVTEEATDGISLVEDISAEAVGFEEVSTGPVIKLTNLILKTSVDQGASDIHLEKGPGGGVVRFRVDGVLRTYMQMPMPAMNRVISRIKIIGKMDIADRLRPQDGRARVSVLGRPFDLRISTIPTRGTEKAVIRLLDPTGSPSLADIGLIESDAGRLQVLLTHRDGIIFVTGPTGSGKTTTLYAALRELATGEVNITTVEDPVEYELPGIAQIQVSPEQGVTFASALRAILRQDPDVVLVGEIRDLETAQIAVRASLTGHLVLATLHTNDALGTIYRLRDMGLDYTAIAECMRGALAQRLIRRVCPACVRTVGCGEFTPEEERFAARHGLDTLKRAVGCAKCGGSGYRGRLPVTEIVIMDPALAGLIASGATPGELREAAAEAGMHNLRAAAADRVVRGETTLDEVERILGESLRDEEEPPGEAAGPGGADEALPHVLLVDDDAVIRAMARALLEKQGFRVSEAEDGAEAVKLLGTGVLYDLIVLDVDMPRLNGRETLHRIRESVATAGIPVIVLTGTSDPEMEIHLITEGADDYIRKPIDPPRFMARVSATLRRAAG